MLIKEQLRIFNQIYKEMDEMYHCYAKSCGLTDTTFWILYALWEQGEGCTQKELCRNWFYISQSVNSALKELEKQEIIELKFQKDNRKNKCIFFTEKGRAYVLEVIEPVMQAELKSFEKLGSDSCKVMIEQLRKNCTFLKEYITKELSE